MDKKPNQKSNIKCPWCGMETEPKTSLLRNQYGGVRERRCSNCGKVLAAYLEEEGEFMSKIRAF